MPKKFAYVQAITPSQVFSLKLDAANEDDMRKLTALQRGDIITFELPVENKEHYIDHLNAEYITINPASCSAIKVLYYTEGLKDVSE